MDPLLARKVARTTNPYASIAFLAPGVAATGEVPAAFAASRGFGGRFVGAHSDGDIVTAYPAGALTVTENDAVEIRTVAYRWALLYAKWRSTGRIWTERRACTDDQSMQPRPAQVRYASDRRRTAVTSTTRWLSSRR